LAEFFPYWSVEERVAAYAIVGGIPAYLEWLDPDLTLVENIREVVLSPGGLFLAEPTFLLYDEVREPRSYLAVLKAIGAGSHTLAEISNHSLIGKTHLSPYLSRLQDLKMIERRLPATVPLGKRAKSRRGRYHLLDPYFRFYFRFLSPFHDLLGFDTEPILAKIRHDLRAFVGQTMFEELAQMWVQLQGRAGVLPFAPETIGGHWDRKVQVDVVAINWHTHDILLGECKWGEGAVNRQVALDLIERKTVHTLQALPNDGDGWTVHYALFARTRFTEAAAEEIVNKGGFLVDLSELAAVLKQV
jgi:AAA+ ATPase superfamily predicted ATPase